jgi:hypothetical protein
MMHVRIVSGAPEQSDDGHHNGLPSQAFVALQRASFLRSAGHPSFWRMAALFSWCYLAAMKTSMKRQYILLLFQKQGGKCCYCDQHVILSYHWRDQQRPDAATIEHLQRRADGGSNHPDNLAMSCKACNDGRHEIDWLTWRSLKRGEFHEYARATTAREWLEAT